MIVISTFPGMGKTYFYNNFQSTLSSYDSDSSKFPKDNFPNNYIDHIKEKLKLNDRDIIFVSSHEDVRQALIDNGINFTVVYPKKIDKEAMIQRYKERGSSPEFVRLLEENYDNFIDSIENMINENPEKVFGIELGANMYMSNYSIMDYIVKTNKNFFEQIGADNNA